MLMTTPSPMTTVLMLMTKTFVPNACNQIGLVLVCHSMSIWKGHWHLVFVADDVGCLSTSYVFNGFNNKNDNILII